MFSLELKHIKLCTFKNGLNAGKKGGEQSDAKMGRVFIVFALDFLFHKSTIICTIESDLLNNQSDT